MVKVYAITSTGPVRKKNQDGFYVNGIRVYEEDFRDAYYESENNKLTAFVCDGVGSTQDGEYAVEKTIKYFINHESQLNSSSIGCFINSVNEFINSCAETYGKTCATTIAGIFADENVTAFNVGDSKVFAVNSGYLEEISKDDTAAAMIKDSSIDSSYMDLEKKLPLLQVLGNPRVSNIETHISRGLPLKEYILCSDGVTDLISIDNIEQIIEDESDIRDRAKKIIEKAVLNGGNDNLTLVYILYC